MKRARVIFSPGCPSLFLRCFFSVLIFTRLLIITDADGVGSSLSDQIFELVAKMLKVVTLGSSEVIQYSILEVQNNPYFALENDVTISTSQHRQHLQAKQYNSFRLPSPLDCWPC